MTDLLTAEVVLARSNRLHYICGMRRKDVLDRLKPIEPRLRSLGVASLYVFGSHARDEAASGSDVDIFVDPADDTFGFMPFMSAYEAIEAALGTHVDYGTRSGLHPLLREEIEMEAVRVF